MRDTTYGACWYSGCERKHVARIKMEFVEEKLKHSMEGKFCAEHFKTAWEGSDGYASYALKFIAANPSPKDPIAQQVKEE